MAYEQEINQAENGTEQVSETRAPPQNSGCPTWDRLGGEAEFPPFFNPNEEMKRKGFTVVFLCNQPRRETPNRFNTGAMDLWFDIQHQGEDGQVKTYTWTVSQVSLLIELRRHVPLAGKALQVQLVPVDEEFKRQRPTYKGKDRYVVAETLLDKPHSLSNSFQSAASAAAAPAAPSGVDA